MLPNMLRRDPKMWLRTPIRHSICRSVRPSRCFSKSSLVCARYDDDADGNGGKKPDGMSDLEWMRQRHLRRWRKRIEENPYQALFGASEDMLKGRGLEGYIQRQREMHRKGLEWVEKTFPKWMLEDLGLRGRGEDKNLGTKEGTDGDGYQTKGKVETSNESEGNETEGMFPQPSHRVPSYRNSRIEKDFWNDGVESPSDSRRPREVTINVFQSHDTLHKDIVQGLRKDRDVLQNVVPPEQISLKADVNQYKAPSKPKLKHKGNALPGKDTTAQETSFIEDFLAEKTSASPHGSSERANSKEWRQTALERMAAQESISKLRRKTKIPIVDVTAKYKALSAHDPGNPHGNRQVAQPEVESKDATIKKAVIDFRGTSGSRVGIKEIEGFTNEVNETRGSHSTVAEPAEVAQDPPKPRFSPYPKTNTDEWALLSRQNTDQKADGFPDVRRNISSTTDLEFDRTESEISARPLRPTSDVLKQLPRDDLDFLTADDVRASMGHMKSKNADKDIVRQKLEQDFNKDTLEIDPMLEARVLNNQFVRRKTNEMIRAQEQGRSSETEPSAVIAELKTADTASKPVSVLETGLDFMSRWLHNGGNVFAQHFWQDPVPLVAGQLAGADEQFLKGIGIGVLKGRRAFASIKDELVEDVPASKELVDRLNRDEIRASAGAVRLYRDLPSALKDTRDAEASKAAAHKRIGQLRQALLDTDKQYKKACEAFDGMRCVSKPSFLQEKRLKYASEVLCKNTKLTRMAVFGLQGRIEVEGGSSDGLVARELLHRLLALQDTQFALSRLVSRSMQVLGINPKLEEEVPKTSERPTVNLSDPSIVEAMASVADKETPTKNDIDIAAANEKTKDEVNKQKTAMHGLSDAGYRHPQKPSVQSLFDGPNPLVHSLFRPFGLQLDNLGKDADAEKDGLGNAAEKAKSDRELAKEVRKVYEDVYGPITVDHWQAQPAERPSLIEEVMEVPQTKTAKLEPSTQLLKEDEVSPSIAEKTSTATMDTISVPQDDVAATESAAQIDIDPKNRQADATAIAEDLRSLNTRDTQSEVQRSFSTEEVVRAEQAAPVTELTGLPGLPATSASSIPTGNEYSYDASTDSYIPISYKTMIYNSETDKLFITTSQVPQPIPPITPIPLHEALATLSHPAKFVDKLPEVFHVIVVKPDVLSVRTASPSNATAERKITAMVDKTSVEPKTDTEEAEGWRGINPVDGTTTLSPTGFVGLGSDLDREFDFAERRRKANEYNREVNKSRKAIKQPEKKERRRIGAGGVVKTAIWAGAFCYIVGVAAEVAKTPFL